MATSQLSLVMQDLRRFVFQRDALGMTDEQLLESFVNRGDEVAFEVLVRRHGAMVMGVCRRVLRNHHDAEDAFQATFLVLARKAGSISPRGALGNWLYRVAFNAALKAKGALVKRRGREREGTGMSEPEAAAPSEWKDLQAVFDNELSRLPGKYRIPIVLCDLEGKTRKDAAQQLGWPEGTVASRLTQARALLAKRLTQRGLALSAAALAGEESLTIASAAVPANLVMSTTKAAVLYAAGQTVTNIVSTQVAALAVGVLQTMFVTKVKTIALVALILGLTTLGSGSLLPTMATTAQIEQKKLVEVDGELDAVVNDAKKIAAPNGPDEIGEQVKKDIFGDALPPNAVARLGSSRLRHGEGIWNLNFSRDGKSLLSADAHGVYIWDVTTARQLRTFGGPKALSRLLNIAASANNDIVARSEYSGEIEIWDAVAGRVMQQIRAESNPYLELTPDGKILVVQELHVRKEPQQWRIRFFDTTTGNERARLPIVPDQGRKSFKLAHDGKSLLTWNVDNTVRLWDIDTGKVIRQIALTLHKYRPVILSPDNRFLATSETRSPLLGPGGNPYQTGPTVLWNLETGKEMHRLATKHEFAHPIAFSPDGKSLITTDNKELRWWDVATGKERPNENIQLEDSDLLAFSPDGTTLAIAGQSTIHLWDLVQRKEKQLPKGHFGALGSVVASPDGRVFATAGLGRMIHFWDSATGEPVGEIASPDAFISRIRFVPNSTMIVTSDRFVTPSIIPNHDENIRVYDASTNKEIRRFAGFQFVLSPDGKLLACCSKERFVHVWELATGQERGKWKEEEFPTDFMLAEPMAFSPDGRSLSYYGRDKKIHVRDAATGTTLRQFEVPRVEGPFGHEIRSVALSADGKVAAFGYGHGSLALQDTATGEIVVTLRKSKPNTSPALFVLAFSADGRMIAGGTYEGKIHVWEIATGQEFRQFSGHKSYISCLAFSADGSRLMSGSQDATGLVWDITGQHSQSPVRPLSDEDLQTHWTELASNEAAVAQRAVGILAARPKQFLPLCRQFLRPVPPKDAKEMDRLVARLGDDNFQTRLAASRELDELGKAAEPGLRRALENAPSLEARRRIDALLKKLADDPERLRIARILQILEQSATPETRETLQSLAGGAAGARLTTEAQAVMARVAKRFDR